jgi:hypothetical protein
MCDNLQLVVMTHDGRQHADEILACWFLQVLHGGEIRIVRSSDRQLAQHADVLLDMGGKYSQSQGRFDHHGKPKNLPTPHTGRVCGFATAGLVWKSYGPRICELLLEDAREGPWLEYRDSQSTEILQGLYTLFSQILDQEIIAPIDAWDLGEYPEKSLAKRVLPFQWILPHLDFESAMQALGKAFIHRLRTLAETVACEKNLERDLWQNGPCEFWVFGEWLVVKAEEGKRVELRAAKNFASQILGMPLLGVVSSLRNGTRWGAFTPFPLPESVWIPKDLEYAAGKRSFFHEDSGRLIQFMRECAMQNRLPVPDSSVRYRA